VESQREKKKSEKAKKASKFKLESRRLAPRFTNDLPASFSSMSGCYLCGKPGHFWRSCYRSRNLPATNSNSGYTWQRQLVQLPTQPTNDDSDETDLVELLEFKNADVIEASTPEQSVQGRIAARKAWWFNNLQLSASSVKLLHDSIRCSSINVLPQKQQKYVK